MNNQVHGSFISHIIINARSNLHVSDIAALHLFEGIPTRVRAVYSWVSFSDDFNQGVPNM